MKALLVIAAYVAVVFLLGLWLAHSAPIDPEGSPPNDE